MGRELNSTSIQMSLALSDLKDIKQDLGWFLDGPDKYTEVFRGLIQTYELHWKHLMLLLYQTLTSSER